MSSENGTRKKARVDDTSDAKPSSSATKREDYLSWDDYFMSVAFLSSMRSKDPSTQVGAAIVNAENRIVGIGYNGFPTGCSDDQLPWDREAESNLDTKYMYVVHAEMNAILNKISASISGARMYVALFPCNECAKLIIQSGIKEVIFLSDKYHHLPPFVASRRMLAMAGVATRQHSPTNAQVVINFGSSTKAAEPAAEDAAKAASVSRIPCGSAKDQAPTGNVDSTSLPTADELAVPGVGWSSTKA